MSKVVALKQAAIDHGVYTLAEINAVFNNEDYRRLAAIRLGVSPEAVRDILDRYVQELRALKK